MLERPAIAAALRPGAQWTVPVAVVCAVLARLPFLTSPVNPDEAGFLMIGGQWHGGGTSLYGNYWVDRPPLLVSVFGLAANLGGLVTLRLIGCIAVAATIVGCAKAAELIAGPRAARMAAVVAAAACATPLLGTAEVNGELLASPFVVWSMAATVAALRSADKRRMVWLSLAAGASATGAVFIKQNLADALVFGVVALAAALLLREVNARRGGQIALCAVAGALVMTLGVALLTWSRGTSLPGVYEAMYPFRLAAHAWLSTGAHPTIAIRRHALLTAFLASGLALLLPLAFWAALTRRLRGAAVIGLAATLAFGVISITLGGNYWAHYLVELIVPMAVLAGVLVARRQPLIRPLIALVVAGSIVAVAGAANAATSSSALSSLGASIAAAARPGDTIVTAYGRANVDQSSGLTSPYEYLWSLPIAIRDPHLQVLERVLSGPNAPIWLVKLGSWTSHGVSNKQIPITVRHNYHLVVRLCGRAIYLRDGVPRPTPRAVPPCHANPTKDAS